MSVAARLEVRGKDKTVLRRWVRSTAIPAGLARRARIVLLAGDGVPNTEIGRRVGVSRQTVIGWRQRYLEGGTAALDDRPRPGRAKQIDEAQVVVATLEEPPERLGVTHWSSRLAYQPPPRRRGHAQPRRPGRVAYRGRLQDGAP